MRNMAHLLALALLATACGHDDVDQDGVPAILDCDDNNVYVYPGATEVCDGLDNDCNGIADDDYALGGSVFFLDRDGDGFGVWEQAVVQCTPPANYVDNADDCADDDNSIFPGAPEFCDKIDQNCNDLLDDDAVDATPYYTDFDLDGYGGTETVEYHCEQPEGFIVVGGDCDDFDPYRNPEAKEFCDYIDNNCDGRVDEADSVEAIEWYNDKDRDGFGDPDDVRLSCYQPEYHLPEAGDCNDEDPDINPDAREECWDGVDNNCDESANHCDITNWKTHDDAVLAISGAGGSSYSGRDIDFIGDFNGDGFDDLIIGQYRGSISGLSPSYTGNAWIVFGHDIKPGAEQAKTDLAPGNGHIGFTSSVRYDYTGYSVEGVGDLNGDGYGDVAIGAYSQDYGGSSAGAVYLVYGDPAMKPGEYNLDAMAGMIFGTASSNYLGYASGAPGDIDADGYDDMLLPQPRARIDGKSYAGKVHVVYGGSDKIVFESADSYPALTGEETYDYVGYYSQSTVGGGDFDGDGYADILVGAPYARPDGAYYAGKAWLVYGGPTQLAGDNPLTPTSDAYWVGETTYTYMGTAFHGVGDVTGDGYEDFALCGRGFNSYSGRCYTYEGGADRLEGEMSLASAAFTITGATSSEYLGYYGVGSGDLTGDGHPEMFTGSYYHQANGNYGAGAVSVYIGGALPEEGAENIGAKDAGAHVTGKARYQYFGSSVNTHAGDFNNDGYDDMLVGAYGMSSYAGNSYLFLGVDL